MVSGFCGERVRPPSLPRLNDLVQAERGWRGERRIPRSVAVGIEGFPLEQILDTGSATASRIVGAPDFHAGKPAFDLFQFARKAGWLRGIFIQRGERPRIE